MVEEDINYVVTNNHTKKFNNGNAATTTALISALTSPTSVSTCKGTATSSYSLYEVLQAEVASCCVLCGFQIVNNSNNNNNNNAATAAIAATIMTDTCEICSKRIEEEECQLAVATSLSSAAATAQGRYQYHGQDKYQNQNQFQDCLLDFLVPNGESNRENNNNNTFSSNTKDDDNCGGIYIGEYNDLGERHTTHDGEVIYEDGSRYVGIFKNNLRSGHGTFFFQDGKFK